VVDFSKAKRQFENVVSKYGTTVQWLARTTSGSDAYDTGSTTTYGYGDDIIYWATGSVKAIIEHVRVQDVLIEAGFRQDDYKRIYVDPDETIEYWSQIIYPSGSGTRYLIQPVHYWEVGGYVVSKMAIIRKLIPRSGSAY